MKIRSPRFLYPLAIATGLLPATSPAAPGDLDPAFTTAPASPAAPTVLALAPDGKILLGGGFTNVHGAPRGAVARLQADGTLDANFTMPVGESGLFYFVPATNIAGFQIPEIKQQGTVNGLGVQSSGRIIVGGVFNQVNKTPRPRLARLLPDGSLDPAFDPGIGPDDNVVCVLVLPDDRILVGGQFKKWGGVSLGPALGELGLVRLQPDGTRDSTLQPASDLGGPTGVQAIAPTADGRFLALVNTGVVNPPSARTSVIRLNADGSRDTSFTPLTLPAGQGHSLAATADGGGIVSAQSGVKRFRADGSEETSYATKVGTGFFGNIATLPDGRALIVNAIQGLKRHLADGTPDTTWKVPTASGVLRVLVLPDGRALASSSFLIPSFSPGVVRLQGDPGGPPSITTFSTDQRVTLGATVEFSVVAGGPGPFSYQWEREGVALPGATNRVLTVQDAVEPGSYRVLVSNASGTTPSATARLIVVPAAPGTVYLQSRVQPGANGRVTVLTPTPDGKIIAAGHFTSLEGTPRNHLARFNPDGSLDATFDTSNLAAAAIFTVLSATVQSSGAVVIAGNLSASYGGQTHTLLRFTPGGALDTQFATAPGGVLGATDIFTVHALPDDRLLIGGAFNTLQGGTPANGLTCLNADGTLNTQFNTGNAGFRNARPQTIAHQPDGHILVALGTTSPTTTYNSTPVKSLVRLLPDGSLDAAFNANLPTGISTTYLHVQSDGRILVAGPADILNPNPAIATTLLRLQPDGSLDPTFDTTPIGPSDTRLASTFGFATQPDSRILVAGGIAFAGGAIRPALCRLNPNGRFDDSFQISTVGPNEADPILAVGILREGAALIGGQFKMFDGEPRTNFARINTGPFDYAPTTPPTIAAQTSEQTLLEGDSATFSVTPAGTPPFRFQWFFNDLPIPDATNNTLTLQNLSVDRSGRYAASVVNAGGTNLSNPNRMTLIVNPRNPNPGTNDLSAFLTRTFAQARIDCFLPLPNARVLVAGQFLPKNSNQSTNALLRLNPDFSIDTDFPTIGFSHSTATPLVTALARDPSGDIVAAGVFDRIQGRTQSGAARLAADGTLDPGFTPPSNLAAALIAPLPDGRYLVGTTVGPSGATLLRLNANGSLDPTFTFGTDYDPRQVFALPDGRFLVSGYRVNRNPQGASLGASLFAGRFLATGQPDPSFNTSLLLEHLFPLPDGKLLATGNNLFRDTTNPPRQIARLHADGTLDLDFTPQAARLGNANVSPNHASFQTDQRWLVAGYFERVGPTGTEHATWHLARFNPDGSADASFRTYILAPSSLPAIAQVASASDGKILYLQAGQLVRLHGGPSLELPAGLKLAHASFVNGTFSLAIRTEPNKSYTLEFMPTLASAAWSAVQSVAGDGTEKTLRHLPAQTSSGFYRVAVHNP